MRRNPFIVCLFLLFARVSSFDGGLPSNFLIFNDATHYSITECTLLELAADYLRAIYDITSVHPTMEIQFGICQGPQIFETISAELLKLRIDKRRLSRAIETITEANTNRDLQEPLQMATHFHNEEFDAGALLVSQLFEAAITSVKAEDFEKARETFGALLHSVQDFYSHSNWVEIGHLAPNQGMGKYQILGTYAWTGMRTCVDCRGHSCQLNIEEYILSDNILTSGYFGSRNLEQTPSSNRKPIGKCSHGGADDYTIETDAIGGGINKDTLGSDHGYLHRIASLIAANATKQILNDFWTMIGNELFGEFLGLAPSLQNISANSLIIVMDDTGSMGPYINMAKQIAMSIVNTYKNLPYPPSNYILSPFNDPTWGPLTISRTPEQFLVELNKLYAHGGGDTPELYYHGIVEALQVCEIGSSLYAFTDAPAKDAYLKGQAVQLAREKRVQITLFYSRPRSRQSQTGRNLSKVTDVIEQLDVIDGTDLPSLTGGVMMGINEQAVNATTHFILQNLEAAESVTLVFAKGINLNMSFHVDSSISSLNIEITSRNSISSRNLQLIKPTGTSFIPVSVTQTPYLLMYSIPIQADEHGQWTFVSKMNADHNIHINARSNVTCSSTLQKSLDGNSSDLNFTPLMSQPVREEKNLFVLTVCDQLPSEFKSGSVQLFDANDASKLLQTLNPVRISPTGFLSRVTVPNENFRLTSVIQLDDGTTIQRGTREIISPTSISLRIDDQPYFVLRQDLIQLNYTIFNAGRSPLTISLRVIDTMNLLPSTGFLNSYTIDAMSYRSDSIRMNTNSLPQIDTNSPIITDSVVFSISALDYKYDQTIPVYIMREVVALTNQTDYQQPPPTTEKPSVATDFSTNKPSVATDFSTNKPNDASTMSFAHFSLILFFIFLIL